MISWYFLQCIKHWAELFFLDSYILLTLSTFQYVFTTLLNLIVYHKSCLIKDDEWSCLFEKLIYSTAVFILWNRLISRFQRLVDLIVRFSFILLRFFGFPFLIHYYINKKLYFLIWIFLLYFLMWNINSYTNIIFSTSCLSAILTLIIYENYFGDIFLFLVQMQNKAVTQPISDTHTENRGPQISLWERVPRIRMA